jgi:hypothetical protein
MDTTTSAQQTHQRPRLGPRRYEAVDLTWKGRDLCLGKRVLATIKPDAQWLGMWRIHLPLPDGYVTDMVNLTRARDAAISHALRQLDDRVRSGGRHCRG